MPTELHSHTYQWILASFSHAKYRSRKSTFNWSYSRSLDFKTKRNTENKNVKRMFLLILCRNWAEREQFCNNRATIRWDRVAWVNQKKETVHLVYHKQLVGQIDFFWWGLHSFDLLLHLLRRKGMRMGRFLESNQVERRNWPWITQ